LQTLSGRTQKSAMRTLAPGKSSLTSTSDEADVTPTSNVGAHISLNPPGLVDARGAPALSPDIAPQAAVAPKGSTAAFLFGDHESGSRMGAASCDFRTRRNQFGRLGLRGTMPIGVKVLSLSQTY
jgi:hypothetical protein